MSDQARLLSVARQWVLPDAARGRELDSGHALIVAGPK